MKLFITGFLLLLTISCSNPVVKNELYAKSHGFSQHKIKGNEFTHLVYMDSRANNSRWHVYIEGDGRPWSGRYAIATDPTIEKPLMLRLMTQDSAPSIYLGRPCYLGMAGEAECKPWFWTHGRYSEKVVSSMATALKKIIQSQKIEELTLIGHSGGGTLAMLLAEHIQQTHIIVSIAGNLDINQWTMKHGYSHLAGSLNPVDRKTLSQSIKQFHFTGMQDTNVSPEAIQRLKINYPGLNHVQVESAGHEDGWDNYFCNLLNVIDGQCLSI